MTIWWTVGSRLKSVTVFPTLWVLKRKLSQICVRKISGTSIKTLIVHAQKAILEGNTVCDQNNICQIIFGTRAESVLILTTISCTVVKTAFYVFRTPSWYLFERFFFFKSFSRSEQEEKWLWARMLKRHSKSTDEHYKDKQTFWKILVLQLFFWAFRGKKLNVDVFLWTVEKNAFSDSRKQFWSLWTFSKIPMFFKIWEEAFKFFTVLAQGFCRSCQNRFLRVQTTIWYKIGLLLKNVIVFLSIWFFKQKICRIFGRKVSVRLSELHLTSADEHFVKRTKFLKKMIAVHIFGLRAESNLKVADFLYTMLTQLLFPSLGHYFDFFRTIVSFFINSIF